MTAARGVAMGSTVSEGARALLTLTLVLGGTAAALATLDAMPTWMHGQPRGVRRAATIEEAERRVLESADSADDPLRFGAGRLNLAAAVRSFAFAKQGLLFGVGAAMALAVSMLARLRGWTRIATIGTAAIAAGGLFFWPVLPLPPSSLGTLLSRPFQEWPTFTLFNVRLVGFPLWQSAIVPAFAVLFLSPSRHIGPLAVGLALGVGTYLLYGAATADIPLWLPMVWGRTWLTENGTIALLAGLAGSGMLNMRQRAAA